MNSADTHLPSDLDLKVREVQIQLAYKQTFNTAFVNPITAGMVVVALWSQVPASRLVLWLAAMVLAQLVRLALVAAYKRECPTGTDILRWNHYQTAATILTALVWGIAIVILWPADSPLHQLVLIFVMLSMAMGSVAHYAPLRASYMPYIAIVMGAVIVRCIYEGTPAHITVAMVCLVSIGLYYVVGKSLHRPGTEALTNRFINEALNQQLTKKTEALQESEARFKGLVGASFEALIIHDQGQILDINPAVTDLFGYTEKELIGSNVAQFLTKESQQQAAQQIQSESLEPYEVKGVAKDGCIIPVEIRIKEIPYQGRTVRVAAGRDISQRKQVEAQQHQIVAMEERERIGRDLHDGLGQVMGYITVQSQNAAEFLRQGKIDLTQTTLNKLTHAAHAAHDDLRHYILGVRTAPDETPANFTEALSRYVDQLQSQYNFTVHISLPPEQDDWPLSPKVETQLLRIIQEALTNTRKHAGVTQANVLMTLTTDETLVLISDKGQGFDLGTRSQEEESRPPSFGLDIMRERAESVGGQLELRSRSGAGTEVIVHLPHSLEFPLEKGVSGLRILLVDDHPLYLEGLRTMLSARGLQVVGMAANGLEAIKLAEQLQPDLILMDVEMPGCNGLEATQCIKADFPEIKIVMLTVAADDETLFKALQAGANGYLLKNLKDREFFTLLNEVMQDEIALSPSLAGRILTEFAQRGDLAEDDAETQPGLTARQQEVLVLVAQGLSNREIAKRLHITYATVKFHIRQTLARLSLSNRYELTEYARKQGFVTPDNDENKVLRRN